MARVLHAASQTATRNQFAREGYTILYPHDAVALPTDELERIATGVTAMMGAIYTRDAAATAQRVRATMTDVRAEKTYLFIVLDRTGEIVASTRLSREPTLYPDGPVFFEAGGVAKSPAASPHFRTSLLLQAHMQWVGDNLASIADYVIATTRVAAFAPGRPSNGKILRYIVNNTTAMPTDAGYFYCVGPHTAEPFVRLSIPTDGDRWTTQVNQQLIFVHDWHTGHTLHSVLAEASRGQLCPDIRVCGHITLPGPWPAFEITPPGAVREAVYLVTQTPPPTASTPHPAAELLGPPQGLSDRVLIEPDVLRDPELANRVYHALQLGGFFLTGWAPSHSQRGKIALTYGRPGVLTPPVRTVARPDIRSLTRTPAVHRLLTEVLQRTPTPPRGER
jgi:hypothetical protein